jgi:transcriptional regulator with XRE-family HTH domain
VPETSYNHGRHEVGWLPGDVNETDLVGGTEMSDLTREGDRVIPDDVEQDRLGSRLKEAREYLGLSQELVAERLGVPRASVSAMETGKRKVSSLELKHLARLYRRPVSYFLGEEEPSEEIEPQDTTFRALYRTTRELAEGDKQQVLRFAQFLRHAGRPPKPVDDAAEEQP